MTLIMSEGWVYDDGRVFANSLPVPAIRTEERDGIWSAWVPLGESGASINVFFDPGCPDGEEVYLSVEINGHNAKVDREAKQIIPLCPGSGPEDDHDGADGLYGCGGVDDWETVDGATGEQFWKLFFSLSDFEVAS